jgi:N utilization substance protein A
MKLTSYEVDVLREAKAYEEYDEDIELIDLKEELGEDVYETLINNRYDTALEVLTAGAEKLMEIEGFDQEKADSIIEIIKAQFEEEE